MKPINQYSNVTSSKEAKKYLRGIQNTFTLKEIEVFRKFNNNAV